MVTFSAGPQGLNVQPLMQGLDGIQRQRNQNALLARRDAQMEAQKEQFAQTQDLQRQRMAQSGSQFDQRLAQSDRQFGQRLAQSDRQFGQNQSLQDRRLAISEGGVARQQEAALTNRFAGLSQFVLQQPPERRAALWQKVVGTHPKFAESLRARNIDLNDVDSGANLIIAEARGFQNPTAQGGFSKQPVYGTDGNGKPVIMQLGPSGQAVRTKLPPGVTPSTGSDKIDLGTKWGILDKRTGQIIGELPKDIAGEAAERAVGASRGKAQINLPSVINEAKLLDRYINSVIEHPAFTRSTGAVSGNLLSVSSDARDFDQRLDQLKGKAFVSAFQRLKGAGAVTDTEGGKAAQALARLQKETVGSKNFNTALEDFRSEIQNLVEQARAKAGGGATGTRMPTAGPSRSRRLTPRALRGMSTEELMKLRETMGGR